MEGTWMEERMGRRLTYKERVDLASEERCCALRFREGVLGLPYC